MVIGDKLPWWFIFKLHAPWMAITALVAAGAFALTRLLAINLPFTPVPFQIAGVALAIFLGFRNNSAYDRWWEGRKLWGGIVNNSRSFARQAMSLFVAPAADSAALAALQKRLIYRHVGWLHALKQQLRGEALGDLLEPFIDEKERVALTGQRNVAAYLLHLQGLDIAEAAHRGWLTEHRVDMFDRTLSELTNLQGGCERIKSTPIPTAYRIFTHRFTRVFVSALPLGLVEHLELATIPILMMLSLAFLVLETLGRILEDPFTVTPNGLALSAITRTIEMNVRQQLGETEVPPPLAPIKQGNFQVLL